MSWGEEMCSSCDLAIWVWIYCCLHLCCCKVFCSFPLPRTSGYESLNSASHAGTAVLLWAWLCAWLRTSARIKEESQMHEQEGKYQITPCSNNVTLDHFRVQFCIWPKVLPFLFSHGKCQEWFCAAGRSLFWDLCVTNSTWWLARVSNTGFISQVTFAVLATICNRVFYLNICLVTRKRALSPLLSFCSLFRIIHHGLSGCPPHHTVL